MANYIEVKVRYDKTTDSGKVRRMTESYLVDALIFTEAETKITEWLAQYLSGDFSIRSMKKTKIEEVYNPSGSDKYWLLKCAFTSLDDDTVSEKKTVYDYLVGGEAYDEACDTFAEQIKSTMADYEIVSVAESSIVEVI